MRQDRRILGIIMGLALAWAPWAAQARPAAAVVDAKVAQAMAATNSRGFALAVIEKGQVRLVRTYGARNAAGDPITPTTVLYAASLTKAMVGYIVVQLAQDRVIDLDAPISRYLKKPLPDYDTPDVEDLYARWSDLRDDARWRRLTPRILLNHGPGFANFGFLEPDGKLRFHFTPGERYAYSGDGLILLQFVLERGLGLDLEQEAQRRVFRPYGLVDSSLQWRADFAGRTADGWDATGRVEPHDQRSAPRAAGSLDTTIADMARFVAAYVRGAGLSRASRATLVRAQLPITTASQFPTLQAELPPARRRADLAAGLGVVVFDGPQGHGFMKGGHNDTTGNALVCLERGQRCVVFMANDVRMEAAYPELARFLLGEAGVPWAWEYGSMPVWRPAAMRSDR